jgi:DNA gyrase/topoisomerase IV subunit A
VLDTLKHRLTQIVNPNRVLIRFVTLRRRAEFQLSKLKARLHIVEGLLVALNRLDDVIALLRESKDQNDAKNRLKSDDYKLSTEQASHVPEGSHLSYREINHSHGIIRKEVALAP